MAANQAAGSPAGRISGGVEGTEAGRAVALSRRDGSPGTSKRRGSERPAASRPECRFECSFWRAEGMHPAAAGIINCPRKPVICPLTCNFTGAPGRIRTRDRLLKSYRRSVARHRLSSLYKPFASRYCRWLSEGVARGPRPLAPRLAPRNLLAPAKVRIGENNVDRMPPAAVVASLAPHPVTLCYRPPRDIACRADAREWPFALRGEVRPSRRI
jgi:hypothetical protein